MRRPRPREVFLSHSDKNRRFVIRLARVLRAHGVKVWYSRHQLRGAQQWHDEIGRALARCDWFVVVLSPASVRSRWVKKELMYAIGRDRYENRILPVLLRVCDYEPLSWTLDDIQRVDFTKDFDRGCRKLLRVWGIKYSRD